MKIKAKKKFTSLKNMYKMSLPINIKEKKSNSDENIKNECVLHIQLILHFQIGIWR